MTSSPKKPLAGSWIKQGSSIVADQTELEIERRMREDLQQVSASDDGWELLFVDPLDGTYWELTFPQSSMHGGGPKLLSPVPFLLAQTKYGL
ncbi:Imm27 family immunity protein [Shimia sp. Alg240-R146]|uniref:Imm27 family immunity protein n=1 Tax=Shimia sp. Alg240-R146 TaxID=2993449 RepID=UPI0022E8BEEE|nr:Imm27 family immunity protein [Shimia sp. Alg240-R146]